MSPPRESYIRASYPPCLANVRCEVDFGLEWRPGDVIADLQSLLKSFAGYGHAAPLVAFDNAMQFAHGLGDLIAKEWPDRAYFIEVSDAAGGWVQVFQPYGLPRRQAEAVLGREEHDLEWSISALEQVPALVIARSLRGDLSPVDVHLHPSRFQELCRHLGARARPSSERRPTALMELTVDTAVGVVRVVSDVTLKEHIAAIEPAEGPCQG